MLSGRLPLEVDLVPYEASFPPGRRWLFLAPHADDEVMAAGATLALARRRGVEVALVVVTDGGAQGDAAVREAEAVAAARELGLETPVFWRLPDRSLRPRDEALRGRIGDVLEARVPDTVFVTSPVDLHPDHRALALALQGVLRRRTWLGARRRAPEWVVACEVGAPLLPNLLVAGDTAWGAKRRAGALYASQLAFRAYLEVMEAFGTLRALTLTGVAHAEGFHVSPSRSVARLSARSWASRMGSPRAVSRPGVPSREA